MSFKFDSQYVFLTYPHSSFDHNEYHAFLESICPTDWCRIATEQHADGDPHVHVVAKLHRRYQSRNQNFLDYNGRHPNIQSVRSVGKALQYVAKDGEFTDFGDIPSNKPKRDSSEALELASDPDESKYLKACLEAKIPYQYAKRIRELALTDDTNTITEYQAEDTWIRQDLRTQEIPSNCSAVLVGPPGIGKSVWAKLHAPKPCLWVSHLDVLRMYRPNYHKSIIFDDMSFKHMPVQAQIHLTDWTDSRQIHCRYGYATIPKQTIKIFTCNEYPFSEHPAIERRVKTINLF